VKDWWLAELGSVNAGTVTITRRGTATVVPHPRRQARGCMLRLMDECRRHPQAGMLMQKEGRPAGGYAFPFCHIAVLSNYQPQPDRARGAGVDPPVPIRHDHHPRRTGPWHALEPQALLARLKACFDPWWPFPKLTPSHLLMRGCVRLRLSETLAARWPPRLIGRTLHNFATIL